MRVDEDYDADEVLREFPDDDDDDKKEPEEPVDELDFEDGSDERYKDLESDVSEKEDLWE
jgi:hypothetical protein